MIVQSLYSSILVTTRRRTRTKQNNKKNTNFLRWILFPVAVHQSFLFHSPTPSVHLHILLPFLICLLLKRRWRNIQPNPTWRDFRCCVVFHTIKQTEFHESLLHYEAKVLSHIHTLYTILVWSNKQWHVDWMLFGFVLFRHYAHCICHVVTSHLIRLGENNIVDSYVARTYYKNVQWIWIEHEQFQYIGLTLKRPPYLYAECVCVKVFISLKILDKWQKIMKCLERWPNTV